MFCKYWQECNKGICKELGMRRWKLISGRVGKYIASGNMYVPQVLATGTGVAEAFWEVTFLIPGWHEQIYLLVSDTLRRKAEICLWYMAPIEERQTQWNQLSKGKSYRKNSFKLGMVQLRKNKKSTFVWSSPSFHCAECISLNKSVEFCDLLNDPLPLGAYVMISVVSSDEQLAEERWLLFQAFFHSCQVLGPSLGLWSLKKPI